MPSSFARTTTSAARIPVSTLTISRTPSARAVPRVRRSPPAAPSGPLVLGEVTAERIGVAHIVFVGPGRDLFLEVEIFLIPVRLHFIHIQPRVVIERQFERARDAVVAA